MPTRITLRGDDSNINHTTHINTKNQGINTTIHNKDGTRITNIENRIKLRKLDENNDAEHHPSVSFEIKTAIQKARQERRMSQLMLASLVNAKVNVIADYENGKAIPDNSFIVKLEKALETKLPRVRKPSKKP